MMKKLSALFIISVIFSFVAQAQTWNNTGPWPDTSWLNGTQGIAVDPDGKVWYSDYWNQDTLDDGTGTRCIYCFHPDGTPASFSPIKVINVGGPFGTYDTLGTKSTYGVKTELKTGNIIYTNSNSDVFLINYKTGDGLAKANLGIGSLACPASDTNGTIFIIDVTAGSIIKMLSWDGFSTTFTDLGNAIENTPDLSRCLEVSADGNTIYAAYLTASRGVLIYHRADEFSPYLVVDSTTFKGWAVESITMHPITGNLWLSGNSYYYTAVDSLTLQNCGQLLTKNVWYAYDFGSSAIVDSIAWLWYPHPDSLSDQQRSDLYRPRGIDFCPTGDTAYIGTFGSNVEWGIERVIRDTPYLGVEQENSNIPTGYTLSQNYPNPFNPSTQIKFTIPEVGLVTVKIFDMLGQEVATLVNEVLNAGQYSTKFNAANLASGTYIYELRVNDVRLANKMLLLK